MGQQRPTLIGVALFIPLLFPSLVSSTFAAFQIPSRKSQQHCFKSYSYHPATAITAAGARKPSSSSDVLRRRLPTLRMGSASSSSSSSTQVSESTKDTFKDKSILLTGASRGLGKSLAHALSNCSPSLLILSGRDEQALKKVQQTCIELGATNVEIAVCDLANKQSVQNLATTSLQLAASDDNNNTNTNNINILINNGGISSRSSFLETTMDVDEQLMQVNFFSGASLAKALVPGMVKNNNGDGGGKVIWISSIQGKLGTPYRTSYAASKFAVQGYCEALRSEMTSSNVSTHVVSPGYIRTNLSMSAVMGDGKSYSKMDETTANGADPDEVAVEILDSVSAGKTDFVVAATFSAKVAMWLKFIAPTFLEGMLVKRFDKQNIESKKIE